jgi:hypothetical protein
MLLSRNKATRDVELITGLPVSLKLRMSGTIPPILHMTSWRAGVPLLMRIPELKEAKTKKLTYGNEELTNFTLQAVKSG